MLAVLTAAALSGCASPSKPNVPPDVPTRTLLVRYQDGATEKVVVATATGLVVGLVQSESKAPLARIKLTLSGVKQVEETGGMGHFLFENVPPGDRELRAEGEGYRYGSATVRITAGVVAHVLVTMVSQDAAPSVPEGAGKGRDSAKSSLAGGAAAPQSAKAPRVGTVELPLWVLWTTAGVVAIGAAFILVAALRRRPRRMVSRGRGLLERGEVGRAEALARKALALRPGDSDAWLLLGASLIKRGAYTEAVRHLEKASQVFDPQVAGIAFLITLAYRHLGRPDRARPWLHLVARDEAYWDALDRQPEAALGTWLKKGVLRGPTDPAYA